MVHSSFINRKKSECVRNEKFHRMPSCQFRNRNAILCRLRHHRRLPLSLSLFLSLSGNSSIKAMEWVEFLLPTC